MDVKDIQSQMDDGSLVIVDAFSSYYPEVDGMKKLIASLSDRAKREGRAGVTTIVDMGFFFLFGGDGRATELINYEAPLAPKTEGGIVKGFSCYHGGNYELLKKTRKRSLLKKGKSCLKLKKAQQPLLLPDAYVCETVSHIRNRISRLKCKSRNVRHCRHPNSQ
jgi:hypothetical protein